MNEAPVLLPHSVRQIRTPIGFTLRCRCGWSDFVPRQNALARAAKIRRLMNEHEQMNGLRPLTSQPDAGTL